jgi:hypothetical protein
MVRDNARDTNKRRSSEKLGRLAEFVAAAFLMLKGYRILACRVRSRFGEIDLIAVRGVASPLLRLGIATRLRPLITLSRTRRQTALPPPPNSGWAGARPAYRCHSLLMRSILCHGDCHAI